MGAKRFWQRFRFSYTADDFLKLHSLPVGNRTRDRDQSSHRCQAVLQAGPLLRRALENCCREAFKLTFVGVSIFSQWPSEKTISGGKTLDLAGFMKPRQKDL